MASFLSFQRGEVNDGSTKKKDEAGSESPQKQNNTNDIKDNFSIACIDIYESINFSDSMWGMDNFFNKKAEKSKQSESTKKMSFDGSSASKNKQQSITDNSSKGKTSISGEEKSSSIRNSASILWSMDKFFRADEGRKPKDELKNIESKKEMNSSFSQFSNKNVGKDDMEFLLRELEIQEQSLPNRWLDYFCIVGLPEETNLEVEEVNNGGSTDKNHVQPTLLDRYPKQNHSDMDFPRHLPTFCFPNGGCHPLKCKMTSCYNNSATQSSQKNVEKSSKKKIPNRHHHNNAPDPFLCSIVLTSSSGHRLYCTSLTIYEMRKERKKKKSMRTSWGFATSNDNVKKSDDQYFWMVPKCLVLISHYPFFQAQSIALKELFYTIQSGMSPFPFERYIAHLLEDIPLPRSGVQQHPRNYTIVEWMSWIKPSVHQSTLSTATIRLKRSPPNQLPTLNVAMEPLLRTLSLSNILVLWANLLQEGKVVLSCSNDETAALLVPIAEALLALLFPLEWQGIYVPMLPNHQSELLDVLEAPVPYLIGLVTKDSPSRQEQKYNHPNGVLWCDLDNDTLHLGFKEDDTLFFNQNEGKGEVQLLPELPSGASMALKAELEEIADPLYLPTVEGIKGRITIGDRSVEMNNLQRQPYAQRTKIFENPIATPRKYILTQSCKIPPRGGKALKSDDFSKNPNDSNKANSSSLIDSKNTVKEKAENCCLTLEEILIPCEGGITSSDISEKGEEKKDDDFRSEGGGIDDYLEDKKQKATGDKNIQDSTFLSSLKRQGRSMQAHVDRAMAVFGQDYATPSEYATQSRHQFEKDVLSRQDEIASDFFSVIGKEKRDERVRKSFLRFFLATFSQYKFFHNSKLNQFDKDGFVASLNISYQQREYLKKVVTTQMFEIFLQDSRRSLKNRKLFDEYIVKYKNKEVLSILEDKQSSDRHYSGKTPLLDSSLWENPTIIFPGQPCRVGLKERQTYCCDRRFPNKLNPDECITNKSASFWKRFFDGVLCSTLSSCT